MRSAELHYELPEQLIALHPAAERHDARLLCVGSADCAHRRVADLAQLLPQRALLVVNDTRVIPARLLGHKPALAPGQGGGKVEVLLVRRLAVAADGSQRWSAMLRASRRVRAGTSIDVGQQLAIVVEGGADDDGLFTIGVTSQSDATVDALLDALGHMPLPPYIERGDEPSDRERYQTRFARVAGAVAAPTAGLHFSDALIADLRASGRDIVALTLHVGPGTFRPVKVDDLDDHPMHAEYFSVSEACAAAVRDARASGVPVIAVGTTVVRALETSAETGSVTAMSGETRLMIQPGHRFRSIDKLITNFHLPGSTLLALVYAFGGTERMRHAYRLAIDERYRFYSYGDAMLIDPPKDEA